MKTTKVVTSALSLTTLPLALYVPIILSLDIYTYTSLLTRKYLPYQHVLGNKCFTSVAVSTEGLEMPYLWSPIREQDEDELENYIEDLDRFSLSTSDYIIVIRQDVSRGKSSCS